MIVGVILLTTLALSTAKTVGLYDNYTVLYLWMAGVDDTGLCEQNNRRTPNEDNETNVQNYLLGNVYREQRQ